MDVSDLRVGLRVGQRVILAIDQKARKRDRVTLKCDCGDVSEVYVNTILVRPYGGCANCANRETQARLVAEHQADLAARYPIGWRFGSREVIGPPARSGTKLWTLPMRCDCGSVADVQVAGIRRGSSGICLGCRNANASEVARAKNAERQAIVSVREQIQRVDVQEEIAQSVEARYRRAELAELNAKFHYTRDVKPLCSCGSTRIYEAKSWCQCMRCGKSWAKQKKGKVTA